MLTWALANIVLSGLALLFASLNQDAPHRLRFHVCLLALLAWLVPWPLLPAWMPDLLSLDLWQMESSLIRSSAIATEFPLILIDTRALPLAAPVTLLHPPLALLCALLLSGAALFLWQLASHHWHLRQLVKSAADGNHLWRLAGLPVEVPILLQSRVSGAFSSGMFKPRIWLHTELAHTPQLATLLKHELTHIRQHDNWYLLLITLVEKLYWWNPLVRILGRQARQLQELSCDARCRDDDADYLPHLAALMLANTRISRSPAQEPPLLRANIFNSPKNDIQRLKVLQRSHRMKPRHIASSIATAALAIASIGLVTAQPNIPAAAERQVLHIKRVGAMTQGQGTDQFMKAEMHDDGTIISFDFTDATLPAVLGPLADLIAGPPALPGLDVVAPAMPAMPAEPIIVHRLQHDPESAAIAVGEGEVMFAAAPLQTFEFEAGSVQAMPPEAGVPARVAFMRRLGADMPASPNLVLEADNARERLITVSGDKLTVEQAIERIATAANCNVFRDGNKLVVDWCGAQ